jgi:hypothetical protein
VSTAPPNAQPIGKRARESRFREISPDLERKGRSDMMCIQSGVAFKYAGHRHCAAEFRQRVSDLRHPICPASEWHNSHIRCGSASTRERVSASGRIRAWDRVRRSPELFSRPYWLDQRSHVPERFLAVGWVGDRLYSVIFEIREDEAGEFMHLVTLLRSTEVNKRGDPIV